MTHPLADHLDPGDPFVHAAERLYREADVACQARPAPVPLMEAVDAYEALAHPTPPPDRPDDVETVYARTIQAGDFIRHLSRWVEVREVKHQSDVGPTFFLVTPAACGGITVEEYAEDAYINRHVDHPECTC